MSVLHRTYILASILDLWQSLDDLQPMCMLVALFIKYTRLVEVVDADLAGGMDDALVAHDDAHMSNVSFLVAKES